MKQKKRKVKPLGIGCAIADEGNWIESHHRKPEEWQWPIFAYFGKAFEGCRGPTVMRSNWNDTFTHWRMIPLKAQWEADKTIVLPEAPKVRHVIEVDWKSAVDGMKGAAQ